MKREELKKKIEIQVDSAETLNHIMILIDEYTKPKGKSLGERSNQFVEDVWEHKSDEYYSQMLSEFVDYWTEHNEGGKKMRFEMAKNQPFNIKRRLVTWAKRSKNYTNGKPREKRIDKFQAEYDKQFTAED